MQVLASVDQPLMTASIYLSIRAPQTARSFETRASTTLPNTRQAGQAASLAHMPSTSQCAAACHFKTHHHHQQYISNVQANTPLPSPPRHCSRLTKPCTLLVPLPQNRTQPCSKPCQKPHQPHTPKPCNTQNSPSHVISWPRPELAWLVGVQAAGLWRLLGWWGRWQAGWLEGLLCQVEKHVDHVRQPTL